MRFIAHTKIVLKHLRKGETPASRLHLLHAPAECSEAEDKTKMKYSKYTTALSGDETPASIELPVGTAAVLVLAEAMSKDKGSNSYQNQCNYGLEETNARCRLL